MLYAHGTADNLRLPDGIPFVSLATVLIILSLVMFAGMFIAIRQLDSREDVEHLITIGGPYTKDRLVGLNKLMDDGHVITGTLYVNSLFGANPAEISVTAQVDGIETVALTRCVKAVPGYSIYKIRMPSGRMGGGKMKIVLTYTYRDKMIRINADYDLDVNNETSALIRVREAGLNTELRFDDAFQRSSFDEALFDPSDDDVFL